MQNVGPIPFVLATIAVIVFVLRRRFSAEVLAALVFLVPFAFYVVSLYAGQAALFVPGAVPPDDLVHQLYNARYGVEVVAPAAIFISTLATGINLGRFRSLGHIVLVGIIVVQSILIAFGGIISLQDGQFGLDCALPHPIVIFLAQHYGGGRIIEDLYSNKIDALNPEAGIDFKNIIYEGSGRLWQQSLRNPASMVNWVIVNPIDPADLVSKGLQPTFSTQFTRDIQEPNGLSLFHRNGLIFPTRPVSTFLLNEHRLCPDTSLIAFRLPAIYPVISNKQAQLAWNRRDTLYAGASQ